MVIVHVIPLKDQVVVAPFQMAEVHGLYMGADANYLRSNWDDGGINPGNLFRIDSPTNDGWEFLPKGCRMGTLLLQNI